LASLVLASSVVAQELREIPALLHSVRGGRMLWVAETAAFDELGELRAEFFSEGMREGLDRQRTLNGNAECRRFSGRTPDNFFPTDSVEALERHARLVVAGEVTAGTQGFFGGTPGTLFAIRVTDDIKSERDDTRDGFVYLFMEDARISTPKGLICARSFAKLPLVRGAKVLFFSNYPPFDSAGMIHQIDPKSQLIVSSNGEVDIPPAIGREGHRTFDEVLNRVRAVHRAGTGEVAQAQ
jgi:hypothetical protein